MHMFEVVLSIYFILVVLLGAMWLSALTSGFSIEFSIPVAMVVCGLLLAIHFGVVPSYLTSWPYPAFAMSAHVLLALPMLCAICLTIRDLSRFRVARWERRQSCNASVVG